LLMFVYISSHNRKKARQKTIKLVNLQRLKSVLNFLKG
jgi:hypothetical protein